MTKQTVGLDKTEQSVLQCIGEWQLPLTTEEIIQLGPVAAAKAIVKESLTKTRRRLHLDPSVPDGVLCAQCKLPSETGLHWECGPEHRKGAPWKHLGNGNYRKMPTRQAE